MLDRRGDRETPQTRTIGHFLVTRFHGLLFGVIAATTLVGLVKIPAGFHYVALWESHATPLWLWPRDVALAGGPILAALLIGALSLISVRLTPYRREMVRHNLDPALTVLLAIIAAVQFSLVLTGIGSDIDLLPLLAMALAPTLVIFGIVFAEAERNTYAGVRLPWTIHDDAVWRVAHRTAGWLAALGGVVIGLIGWFNPDIASIVFALPVVLLAPFAIAAAISVGR